MKTVIRTPVTKPRMLILPLLVIALSLANINCQKSGIESTLHPDDKGHMSTYVDDTSADLNETSTYVDDTFADLNETSTYVDDTFTDLNGTSAYVDDTSADLNDTSTYVDDTSADLNDTSTYVDDTSADLNDTSAYVDDTSADLNDTSTYVDDTFADLNDTSTDVDDTLAYLNDMSTDQDKVSPAVDITSQRQQQNTSLPDIPKGMDTLPTKPFSWLSSPRKTLKAWQYKISDYSNHPCKRACSQKGQPMMCRYTFVVENYAILSRACWDCPFNQSHCSMPHCVAGDGEYKAIKVVNRMMPGPAVDVCEGDQVEVTVINRLDPSEVTTIHWHGQLMRGTPHMDGVGFITQCPITYNSQFKYRFTAKDAGTHYWHAHSGPQRADGIYGPLFVRKHASRFSLPNGGLYDKDLAEHVMVIHDWTEDSLTDRMVKYSHVNYDAKPRLMLVNGKGRHREFLDSSNNIHYTPYAEFKVTPKTRYRFRLISNGIGNCPIQFSIDNHTMTIIESDGHSLQPFTVDSVVINSGERYDFVLNADQIDPLRNFWIRLRGYNNCRKKQASQTAILRYEGAPDVLPAGTTTWEDAKRQGVSLNPAIFDSTVPRTSFEISEMHSAGLRDPDLSGKPDRKIFLAIEFQKIPNKITHHDIYYPHNGIYKYNGSHHSKFFSPHINWITNMLPPSPPLSQLSDLPWDTFCNAETLAGKNCKEEWCACTHHYKIDKGSLVELIIVDEGILSHAYHPMHLHGYSFGVVAMGKLGENTTLEDVKTLDAAGGITRRFDRPPIKDTVVIPDGGYTVIRFKANNPGFWLLHCHVEFHSATGMSMVFQVGEQSQMEKTPRMFPKCGGN